MLGLALGLLLGCNINGLLHGLERILNITILDPAIYLERIPIVIQKSTIALIGFLTLGLSLLAALLPAARASKQRCLDLLRKV
jgi:lipoprotein-releasing system permease protein